LAVQLGRCLRAIAYTVRSVSSIFTNEPIRYELAVKLQKQRSTPDVPQIKLILYHLDEKKLENLSNSDRWEVKE
jgi:hypothetical protein